MEIYVAISLISKLSPFSGFKHDFIIYIEFTRIAASDTTTYVYFAVFCERIKWLGLRLW